MPSRRRLVGAGLVLAASAWGVLAVAERCGSWRQLSPALISALPTLVELLTATAGLLLVTAFWPGRLGSGLHCGACGYSQERRGKLAPACPECGAMWLWIGNTRKGSPTGSLGPLALGLALCLLALGASMVQSVSPWVYLRLLPQRMLLAQVTTLPDDATGEYWAEISRRGLPPSTLDTLAEPLLRKKARDGYLSRAAEIAVFDAMMRPGAPATLSATYFASFLKADLDTPASIEEGGQLLHKSVATFRGHPMTLGTVPRVIVISALYAGADPEPIHAWTWDVDPESTQALQRPMDFSLTPNEPGLLRLRQAFWLVIGSPNSDPISWENGQPQPPIGMSVKDHFEYVREVTITPRPKKKSVPPG